MRIITKGLEAVGVVMIAMAWLATTITLSVLGGIAGMMGDNKKAP